MDTQTYLRSLRPVLTELLDDGDNNSVVDRITDYVRDLLVLDAVLELVRGNDPVARRIMEDVREMIQWDYIESIRRAATMPQIMQLIHDDPWGNDPRVAISGLERILELVGPEPEIFFLTSQLYESGNLGTTMAVLSSRMAAHRTNENAQQRAVEVAALLTVYLASDRPHFSAAVARDTDVFESLVTAMMLHEHHRVIQGHALISLYALLGPLWSWRVQDAPAGEIVTRLVQAPEGNGQGIHAIFRALENFPAEEYVVGLGFFILHLLDRFVHQRLVEYTDAHDDWREILGNTDAALRNHRTDYYGTILGTRFADF